MSKKDDIAELVNILAAALRHKIGSQVNSDEIYAQKYAKDAQLLMKEALKNSVGINFNSKDKAKLRMELEIKLRHELETRDFLDNKKFEMIDSEIDSALKVLNLE
jgi:hypothetical protein